MVKVNREFTKPRRGCSMSLSDQVQHNFITDFLRDGTLVVLISKYEDCSI